MWKGKMLYQDGHPEGFEPNNIQLDSPFVSVTEERIEYTVLKRRWFPLGRRLLFTIDKTQILDVRHEQLPGSLFGADHHAVVRMQHDDGEFDVRFKAHGLVREENAIKFVQAVKRLIAG
ncbi:hypothetical protein LCGC14_2241040 [marine sediment metagenome]|uniref:YokE-like PH domain-containing protein n=1 Tax=marine sediment metagenome TaxID=412755 RepID=A0A0F9FI08_9ZZZZ